VSVVEAYRRHPALAHHDELLGPAGADLAAFCDEAGLGGLRSAAAEADKLVGADGIVYGAAASDDVRPWRLDPLPVVIGADEWDQLERGLRQRARLLSLIHSDVYGGQELLRSGDLPAAVVLGHGGYFRGCRNPGRLWTVAADLGRGPDGRWRVLADRNEAPSGIGYAMAARRVVSSVLGGLHRHSDLRRLRGFFHRMAATLLAASPNRTEEPQAVVLSAGVRAKTAFDEGFLATLLGFTLAEADDLVTRQGRVWLRAGDGLNPVEVVMRRIEGGQADPLEFDTESVVGVPGLAEAVRTGGLTLANPLGCGVLNSPALGACLPRLAERLLGETLELDGWPTWWCGEETSRAHVLANLDGLELVAVDGNGKPVDAAVDRRRAMVAARPEAWCARLPQELSTAPVVAENGLEPRRFVLRAFGLAGLDQADYSFLPGGFGRVAGSTEEAFVSSLGALAKDVWVPRADAERAAAPQQVELAARPAHHGPARVTPRVAGTLMAIGRFAERAQSKARLLKVADDLASDYALHPLSEGYAVLGVMLGAVEAVTSLSAGPDPSAFLRGALASEQPGGLRYDLLRLTANAQQVRDVMSADAWSVLARLLVSDTAERAARDLPGVLDDVLTALLAFSGIVAESMVRDASWAFLDAGARLERARQTLSLLQVTRGSGPVAERVAEAVLAACESGITHRRRAASGQGPASAAASELELLVDDAANPRSVAHQLRALAADLELAGDADTAERLRRGFVFERSDDIDAWLADRLAGLSRVEAAIARRHFSRQASRHATWSGEGS
jgi:uncharacterized circularly permuted ATP-grasp superfamily protein/uncharacterized alpha-E superfamily protein